MRFGSRISFNELKQVVFQLKKNVPQTFLKNVYHYERKWLFKFSTIHFVFDFQSIWFGEFLERENKNLHSISIKLRKELGQMKCFHVDLLENDRTICFDFGKYWLLLEMYAKGNILLIESDTKKIVVLTRCFENFRNNVEYPMKNFHEYSQDFVVERYGWKNKQTIENCENGEFESIVDASSAIWETIYNKKEETRKKKKEKKTPRQNIENQVKKFNQKIQQQEEKIDTLFETDYQNIDYKLIGKLEKEKKINVKKLEGAKKCLETIHEKPQVEKITQQKIQINQGKWYHQYYWWYTKNGFLVVGGKNANDNEILVKNYLREKDYYFHSDEPGSGSFILFVEEKLPEVIDLHETSEGVFSLSKYWNIANSGKIFHVHGNQVSKTPPTGLSLSKGSFMIYGKKEYINIHQTILGYVLYGENELMLAPYRIVERFSGPKIKILPKPNVKKMKGKFLLEKLQKGMNIDTKQISGLFSRPCNLKLL